MTLRLLSLFSGIGGIDLAARWAGMETVGLCEIDPFCRQILGRHWPGVWIHDDVRTLTGGLVREQCGAVDILAGGFPCQDISTAGKGEGIEGARSGLWFEMLRVIAELRPTWVVVENVPALRTRGIDTVTAGLEAEGYTVAAPMVVGAWAVGAPHRRDRVWIVAHSGGGAGSTGAERAGWEAGSDLSRSRARAEMVNPEGDSRAGSEDERPRETTAPVEANISRADRMADPDGSERWAFPQERDEHDGHDAGRQKEAGGFIPCGEDVADSSRRMLDRGGLAGERGRPEYSDGRAAWRWPARPGEPQHGWEAPRIIESSVGDSVDGVSRRVVRDRVAKLKALGNAVVPQVVYPIFEAIARIEASA